MGRDNWASKRKKKNKTDGLPHATASAMRRRKISRAINRTSQFGALCVPCGKLEIIVRKVVCCGVNLNIDTKMKLRKKLIAWNSFLEKKQLCRFIRFGAVEQVLCLQIDCFFKVFSLCILFYRRNGFVYITLNWFIDSIICWSICLSLSLFSAGPLQTIACVL